MTSVTMPNCLKRKLQYSGECPSKKPKNAVCALYEMFKNVIFKVVDQSGPVHQPLFTIAVNVNGTDYQGSGKTKKLAKQAAAAVALRSIIQTENPFEAEPLILPTNMDFTQDELMEADFETASTRSPPPSPGVLLSLNTPPTPRANGCKNSKSPSVAVDSKAVTKFSADKGPVMLLNELHPNATYEIISEKGEPYNKYTTAVLVDTSRFEGTGASKKLSKAAAAKSALASLHNITFTPTASPHGNAPDRAARAPIANEFEIPQVFADHIAYMVIQKFTELVAKDKDHSKRKVLAGLVMSNGMDVSTCRVLAVTTGTKCIKGEHMSVNGATVYDSHAEIIARIFSPHDEEEADKHPNRNSRGKLRTKIESGEGTIPVKSDEPIQTWDGIIQGERLLTMSCSDKIARWNVVGLQGSLLSRIVQPIYLDSLVLGGLFHPGHLHRAIIGRLQNYIQGLPCPFHINTPRMALISSKEVRNTGKAPNFSVNWTEGDDAIEVVNAMTGRTEEQQISRLAKKKLFEHYHELVHILPSIDKIDASTLPPTYYENKQLSSDYQTAKTEFYSALSRAGQGKWVKKPPEAEQFEMPVNSQVEVNNELLSAIMRAEAPLL